MNTLVLCLFIVSCRPGIFLGAYLGAYGRPRASRITKWQMSAACSCWFTKAGGKLGRWKYRFQGKEKKMSFGQYPEVTLAEVRVLYAAARRLLIAGIDPMSQRRAERRAFRDNNELPLRVMLLGGMSIGTGAIALTM
jgi:hypothetical protein